MLERVLDPAAKNITSSGPKKPAGKGCFECGDLNHWAADCPRRKEKDKATKMKTDKSSAKSPVGGKAKGKARSGKQSSSAKRYTYDTIGGKRMRKPYRPSAKEAAVWETDPETASEEEEDDESDRDKQDEDSTEQPGTEETKEPEADSNPLVFKALIEKLENCHQDYG